MEINNSEGINVLSLFDGKSGGQQALERNNIKIKNYYASEVDKHAIKVSMTNYPNTIQLGSVVNVDGYSLPKIDLLIGGSPCQSFSFSGKRKGMITKCEVEILTLEHYLELKNENYQFEGQSYLFWEYIRLLKEVKPKYFLLENVKMVDKWEKVLTEAIGVKGIHIDSALVSAQRRKRIYWTNIPNVTQPLDKGILLKDIIHETKNEEFDIDKYIVPFDKTLQILDKEVQRGKVGYFRQDSQANRVYYIHDKAVTLCGASGGGAAKMGQYLIGCITPDRLEKRQNGQRFSDGKKFYTLTVQDRHGILIDGYIRKLTPIECERLQTVKENFTNMVSDSQRYKMLGNGWTIDVVSHIFSFMENI